jgi:hypothetical protein
VNARWTEEINAARVFPIDVVPCGKLRQPRFYRGHQPRVLSDSGQIRLMICYLPDRFGDEVCYPFFATHNSALSALTIRAP